MEIFGILPKKHSGVAESRNELAKAKVAALAP
jgi:hypothetical protein